MKPSKPQPTLKFFLLVGLVVVGIVLTQLGPLAAFFKPEVLRQCVEACRNSGWGAAAFVAIYVIGSMLALPSAGFSFIGGAVFGFWDGLLYNYIGANLGAFAAYAIARALGRESVQSWIRGDRLMKLQRAVERGGYPVIVAFRILPLLPFNAVNFGSALLRIRFRDYAVGTMIGTFPATALFTYYAALPGGGRDWRVETAVIAIAITALIGSWTVFRKAVMNDGCEPQRSGGHS